MCGISGIYSLDSQQPVDIRQLRQMTDLISHRGPDDEGYCLFNFNTREPSHFSGRSSSAAIKELYPALKDDVQAQLAFGFRRLAILDLSPAGHQPMSDEQLGLHIVFNGEIYNYLELRDELRNLGYSFNSQSDTEVILKAYSAWGENCVQHFNGIWSFALWDDNQPQLFCSRDRFGVKPFYYCVHDGMLLFGSEIKQLLAGTTDQTLNKPMLRRSMKINSLLVYGDETFWQGIKALEPGHNLLVRESSIAVNSFYRLDPDTFEKSSLSFADAEERYRELFLRAVKWQMRSDVEVGACLSGGLDSSAIVCTASKLSELPMQTFSSWFSEVPALDERRWIAEVASQCGCVSHLTSPRAEDAIDWFSDATWYNDLPVGAGFAAQYAVMRLAQGNKVKVLLDGQGSDELTAGYKHAQYRYFADLLRSGKLGTLHKDLHSYFQGKKVGDSLASLAKIILSGIFSESQLYQLEFKYLRFEPFNKDFLRQAKAQQQSSILGNIEDFRAGRLSSFLYNMIYTTSLQTLLHYEDRMSMAASIESRVPFLDHELVELAFSLPSSFKVKPPQGKLIHRSAMKNIVPTAIYERKDKAIFGSPFHQLWLRNGMRHAVEELFASTEFRQRGIWNLPQIDTHWRKYLSGDNSQAEMIFNVFALETWFRVFEHC